MGKEQDVKYIIVSKSKINNFKKEKCVKKDRVLDFCLLGRSI